MIKLGAILDWFENRGCRTLRNRADLDQLISRPRNIFEAEADNISFISEKLGERLRDLLQTVGCRILVLDATLFDRVEASGDLPGAALIRSSNPKADLMEFCQEAMQPPQTLLHPTISAQAIVAKSAKIGADVHIDPFVCIEDEVVIGAGSRIGANTVIGKGTIIGAQAEIGACNVIGGTGFGYAKQEKTDEYQQFPHFGRVVIGDRVHIGNNTCIDRGSLSDTIIESGVKIDNLVHIAHNVKIGENSLVIACSMIAGSVVIGKNCWVAPAASVRNDVTIGDRSTVGLGSTVTKSVAEDKVVTGSPAMPLEDFLALRSVQREQIEASKQK